MKSFVVEFPKRNQTAHWDYGSDTEKSWRRNKKKLGTDWYYYDKGPEVLNYQRNEYGFRERSFQDIDWNNYIAIFGCSVVEGIGNILDDTIAKNLEKIIGIPVLNFGISGSAVDCACVNSLILHNHYPRPKAIIQFWTGLSRYTDFLKNTDARVFLPHKKGYNANYLWEQRSKYYIESDRALWKGKTIYLEATTFPATNAALKDVNFFHEIDKARDFSHPGYKTNRIIAQQLATCLNEKGL